MSTLRTADRAHSSSIKSLTVCDICPFYPIFSFNAFNAANFADPVGNLTNSLFGRSTQMLGRSVGGLNALYQIGGPRSIQLGVKLGF